MTVKAKVSFIGKVCMNCGEVLDIDDSALAMRLVDCGYVDVYDSVSNDKSSTPKKRSVKKSESK